METKAALKRIGLYIAGWGFIILGILGLFLPILQGILFILIGLFLLSSVSPWAERMLNRLRERFPRIGASFDQAKSKAKELQTKFAAKFSGGNSNKRRRRARITRRKHRKRKPKVDAT